MKASVATLPAKEHKLKTRLVAAFYLVWAGACSVYAVAYLAGF